MGKIRVKMLGDQTLEQEQKKETKKRKEAKKTAKVPGMKGGERVVSVGPSEEELMATTQQKEETTVPHQEAEKAPEKKPKRAKKHVRSATYLTVAKLVDKGKTYMLKDAVALLSQLHLSRFDETVELHINTLGTGISGTVSLPHGSGKKIRVAIANPAEDQKAFEELLKKIEADSIEFDVLIATPDAMPKLAKVARILGPRGLMPNPKNATVTTKPEELAKQYEGGQVRFKTEAKSPIIHMTVGKLSFGDKKLSENITTALSALPHEKIKNVTLKSTMSPGIKIQSNAKETQVVV